MKISQMTLLVGLKRGATKNTYGLMLMSGEIIIAVEVAIGIK